jgi:uncharacterized damage-inducible protein DinB
MDVTALKIQLGLTHHVVMKSLQDITHEESLRAPRGGGNCLNWVLGHLVGSRQNMLELLGQDPSWSEEQMQHYRRGAPPMTDSEGAAEFGRLLQDFDACQEPLLAALEAVTPAQLAAKVPRSPFGNREETVGSLLAGLVFHEAYHVGQTGLQRRLLGKEGWIR